MDPPQAPEPAATEGDPVAVVQAELERLGYGPPGPSRSAEERTPRAVESRVDPWDVACLHNLRRSNLNPPGTKVICTVHSTYKRT